MPRLSAIIITHNEQAEIRRCLASVGFCDEIVVVDHGSTDDTVALARSLGAVVIETSDWPGFGPQKNRALDAASGDWVLTIDADEWIEPPLANEIRAVIADLNAADGYEMPRRSRFCGHIVRHSGWSPDFVLRLFRRTHGRFNDDLVHEKVILRGRPGRLKHPIQHNSIADAADALDKVERYATAMADMLIAKGKRASKLTAVARASWALFNTLILRGGFLDGRTGLGVAMYNFRYTYRKWMLVAKASHGAAPSSSSSSAFRSRT
jgi:glycosyltransferase involved in cell wall biosynthesis